MNEYASFVTVKTIFGEKVPVTTKEEYEKFCDNIISTIGLLGKRIDALEEERNSVPTKGSPEEEKKLWKVKYVEEEFYGNEYNTAFVDKEKDIRKLTKIEAEEWLYQVQKERNVYHPKLFYKEDGEWIIYEEEK